MNFADAGPADLLVDQSLGRHTTRYNYLPTPSLSDRSSNIPNQQQSGQRPMAASDQFVDQNLATGAPIITLL
jgi:hypothetical protein